MSSVCVIFVHDQVLQACNKLHLLQCCQNLGWSQIQEGILIFVGLQYSASQLYIKVLAVLISLVKLIQVSHNFLHIDLPTVSELVELNQCVLLPACRKRRLMKASRGLSAVAIPSVVKF